MIFKNLSIPQISFYIVLVLIISNTLVAFLTLGFDGFKDSIVYISALFFIAGMIVFFLIRYLLETYVFRKIKVIYRIIQKSKMSKEERDDLDKKSLDDVNSEVLEWAEDTQKEIMSLKTLEKYRKDFVGNISHELKTPIFSIQGYLYTLLDGGIHDDSININYLKRAANNVERLQMIVEDLEAISRMESGKKLLDIQKFDLNLLVLEVFQDLRVLADEKNVTLSMNEENMSSIPVLADRENIRQVLNNLIVNAIKYGNENGKIIVSYYDIDKNVLIEVSDDGIGISEEHIPHLFDRFYRADKSRSRQAGGSGLGLAIVKHIIEAHNQTINVRSTVGIGSTFGFTLRRA